jgi:hypothetical protein
MVRWNLARSISYNLFKIVRAYLLVSPYKYLALRKAPPAYLVG